MRWTAPLRLLVLTWLAVASAAPAAPGEGPGPGRRHEPPPLDALLERFADRLGLDADTLNRIRTLADASRPEHERLADELHALRGEMRGLLDQDEPDRDAVMQLADRIGAAETRLDKHRLATMLQIRALLTPNQRQELVRIFEEHRRERHRGREPGGGPPEP